MIKEATVKEIDEPTFVRIKGVDFKNGTIEVKVLNRLLKNVPGFARDLLVLLSGSTRVIQNMRVYISTQPMGE